jgi:hypothetical protein
VSWIFFVNAGCCCHIVSYPYNPYDVKAGRELIEESLIEIKKRGKKRIYDFHECQIPKIITRACTSHFRALLNSIFMNVFKIHQVKTWIFNDKVFLSLYYYLIILFLMVVDDMPVWKINKKP